MSLRFFWGPRREDSEMCAQRLLTHWQLLRDIHPLFTTPWFPEDDVVRGYNFKPLEPSVSAVSRLLVKGMNHTDIPRRPIPELGFRARVTSVDEQPERLVTHATIHVHCGCYSNHVKNSLQLYVSDVDNSSDALFSLDGAIALVTAAVTAWEPEVGQVHWSVGLSDAIDEGKEDIQVGWITYLSHALVSCDEDSASEELIAIPGKGVMIVAVRERFSPSNPVHIAAVKRVADFVNGLNS